MIVRAKSAHFVWLPTDGNEYAEWLNLANVTRVTKLTNGQLVVEAVGSENLVYSGKQAEVLTQELTKICPEQMS